MKIIVLGAPGVGKGTVAAMLSKKYGLPHISTGDIFKDAIRNETTLGLKVRSIVETGQLVPDEITNEIIRERLEKPDVKNGFFLDGYPRTIEQANAMDTFAKPDLALNFSADRNIIIERLSGRRVCTKCGAIYHIRNNPPKKSGTCDNCLGKLIMRKDDSEAVIINRLDVYERQTKPLIGFYRKKGLLAEINSGYQMNEMEKIIKQCDDAIARVKNG
ncbi:adenylate kinase [Candidatus Woesearchaeota archaeon]|nr:adenylate kinase [Candidatus Woesearchaeota archaeon]